MPTRMYTLLTTYMCFLLQKKEDMFAQKAKEFTRLRV